MRRSSGTPALRSTIAFCTSMAQRTASTTLRNSTMLPIAGALDDAAVMHGDSRINQVAAKPSKPGENAIFVRSRETAVADHVGAKDRRKFSSFGHRVPLCHAHTRAFHVLTEAYPAFAR